MTHFESVKLPVTDGAEYVFMFFVKLNEVFLTPKWLCSMSYGSRSKVGFVEHEARMDACKNKSRTRAVKK